MERVYCTKCKRDITHTKRFYPKQFSDPYCYSCAKEMDISIGPLVNAEEAIELTTSAFSAWEGECETGDDWSKEHEARDLAINALRKQIPELPNIWGDGYADGEPVYDMWDCPYCGKTYEIEGEQYDFCPACGQRINWQLPDGDPWYESHPAPPPAHVAAVEEMIRREDPTFLRFKQCLTCARDLLQCSCDEDDENELGMCTKWEGRNDSGN